MKDAETAMTAALIWVMVVAVLAAGWLTNLIWLFFQHDHVQILLGIMGIFIPIVGALHGIYIWL